MNYYVTRGGQQYGPYSLADLQRYVASGNILPTDMARSDGMSQWLPVSQIIGNIAVPPQAPQRPPAPQQPISPQQPMGPQQPQGYGQVPAYAPQQGVAPQQAAVQGGLLPPGLHWALVLVLAIFTCGIFSMVWIFIEAAFVKKLRPNSNALMLYAVGIGAVFASAFMNVSRSLLPVGMLLNLGGVVVMIMAHFQMKAAIEEYYNSVEPINLRLSGVMVFFFNVFYFQYHFTRIREWKTTGVWR
jgi:hypothetical protein